MLVLEHTGVLSATADVFAAAAGTFSFALPDHSFVPSMFPTSSV